MLLRLATLLQLMPVTLSVPAQGEPMAREIIVYS